MCIMDYSFVEIVCAILYNCLVFYVSMEVPRFIALFCSN